MPDSKRTRFGTYHDRKRATVGSDSEFFPETGGSGCFERRVEYYNYSRYPVKVTDANDVSQVVSPRRLGLINPKEYDNKIVIRHSYRIIQSNYNQFIRMVYNRQQTETPYLKELRRTVDGLRHAGRLYDDVDFHIILKLDIEDILPYPNGIFEELSGCVYSIEPTQPNLDSVFHLNPHGVERFSYINNGEPELSEEDKEALDLSSHVMCIDVVDNHNRAAPRFVNNMGFCFRVIPRKDVNKKDGVYFYYSHPDGKAPRTKLHCIVEELSILEPENGFYKTMEEAKGAKEDIKYKLDIDRLKLEKEVFELKSETARINSRTENEKAKREEERLKKEKQNKESFGSQTKEFFSVIGEVAKAVGLVVGTIVAGVKLFSLFSSVNNNSRA